MDKREARKIAKERVNKLSDAEREWASGCIADALCSEDRFKSAHSVFIFYGAAGEPDTEEIIGLALGLEKTVSLPRVNGAGGMEAVIVTPYSNFKKNKWGIYEPDGRNNPVDIDVAIVPMVAFDGVKRLGHGGGYYDRFLSAHKCYKVGIAFDVQKINGFDTEKHDVKMDMVITEREIIKSRGIKPNAFGG